MTGLIGDSIDLVETLLSELHAGQYAAEAINSYFGRRFIEYIHRKVDD